MMLATKKLKSCFVKKYYKNQIDEQKILENAFKRLVKELSATLKAKEEVVHADLKKLLSKEI